MACVSSLASDDLDDLSAAEVGVSPCIGFSAVSFKLT